MQRSWAIAGLALAFGIFPAKAQEAVPGGWSPRFEYRNLGPVAPAPQSPEVDARNATTVPVAASRPRVQNALRPLGSTIRRTIRPRRGR